MDIRTYQHIIQLSGMSFVDEELLSTGSAPQNVLDSKLLLNIGLAVYTYRNFTFIQCGMEEAIVFSLQTFFLYTCHNKFKNNLLRCDSNFFSDNSWQQQIGRHCSK